MVRTVILKVNTGTAVFDAGIDESVDDRCWFSRFLAHSNKGRNPVCACGDEGGETYIRERGLYTSLKYMSLGDYEIKKGNLCCDMKHIREKMK